MFDQLIGTALRSQGASAVGVWARVENAACARRLAAMAAELERMLAAEGSEEREQWCLDNWDAVAASVAAAQNVSLGMASHQLLIADALRRRLPRVAEVFAAGTVSYRMVAAVVTRTRLIRDRDAIAKVDIEIAARLSGWGSLSVEKTKNQIDYWVDRYDPAALRRTEDKARGRHVDVHTPDDGAGTADLAGQVLAADAAALDARLESMAAAVCGHDPRTLDQRRADALGALAHGGQRLVCACGEPDCAAAGTTPRAVVIHVVANEDSLSDDTPAQLNGHHPPSPRWQAGVCTAEKPTGPPATAPAAIIGGAMLPAPVLAAQLAASATLVPIVHPGDNAPEQRYTPSTALAWFVRCRDMTCRFPGCDAPAHHCDIDHTIAHPRGPTQASNLKCLCRKHHLLKTFWGWHDQQHPDGTVIWTSPQGQTYTTHPGSRLLFPALCRPTAPLIMAPAPHTTTPARTQAMPRRATTRTQNRTQAINDERKLNQAALQGEAQERARDREQLDGPERDCGESYSPYAPRFRSDDDPPPF